MGVLGSPSLDHQLQQAVMQVLALGMKQVQFHLAVARGSSSSGGQPGSEHQPSFNDSDLPQLRVYVLYMRAVQELLQCHGGRLLLAGGDPACGLKLVAMLRGMAAAQQQQVSGA